MFSKIFSKLGFIKKEEVIELISSLVPPINSETLERIGKIEDFKEKQEEIFKQLENDRKERETISSSLNNLIDNKLQKVEKERKISQEQLKRRIISPLSKQIDSSSIRLSEVNTRLMKAEENVKGLFQQDSFLEKEIKEKAEAAKASVAKLSKKIENPFFINNLPVFFNKSTTIRGTDIKLNKDSGIDISTSIKNIEKRLEEVEENIKNIQEVQSLSREEYKELKKLASDVTELLEFKKDASQKIEKLTHPIVKRKFHQDSLEDLPELKNLFL